MTNNARTIRSALVLACTVASTPDALAQPTNCDDLSQANAVNAGFDADTNARQDTLTQHTAERLNRIDARAKALVAAGVWTQEDRFAYFRKQRSTQAYTRLEQAKKEPLFSVQIGRSTVPGIKAKNPTGACGYAVNVFAAYDELLKITDTQYYMLEQGISEIAASRNITLP